MGANGGNLIKLRGQGKARGSIRELRSYPHGKLLLSRAQRELASLERLKSLSPELPLTNDAWRILLQVLVDTLHGEAATIARLAGMLGLSADVTRRYIRVLETERLVLRSGISDLHCSISIGDEGLLRVARYFLPEAANE